jgi:hypothetical protein
VVSARAGGVTDGETGDDNGAHDQRDDHDDADEKRVVMSAAGHAGEKVHTDSQAPPGRQQRSQFI